MPFSNHANLAYQWKKLSTWCKHPKPSMAMRKNATIDSGKILHLFELPSLRSIYFWNSSFIFLLLYLSIEVSMFRLRTFYTTTPVWTQWHVPRLEGLSKQQKNFTLSHCKPSSMFACPNIQLLLIWVVEPILFVVLPLFFPISNWSSINIFLKFLKSLTNVRNHIYAC